MSDYKTIRKLGFKYMDSPHLCANSRLKFNITKNEFVHIVYAIMINQRLMYIGITKDFYYRVHTYRNSKYWCNAWPSNKKKTHKLEQSVRSGKQVEFYCLQSTEDDYEHLEKELIAKFNPKWNKIFCC